MICSELLRAAGVSLVEFLTLFLLKIGHSFTNHNQTFTTFLIIIILIMFNNKGGCCIMQCSMLTNSSIAMTLK